MNKYVWIFLATLIFSLPNAEAGNFKILYGDWASVAQFFDGLSNYEEMNGCKFNVVTHLDKNVIHVDVTDSYNQKAYISLKLDQVKSKKVASPYTVRLIEQYEMPDRNISNILHIESDENGEPVYFEYLEFNTEDVNPTKNIYCGFTN
jgi:hypothetical protein